MKMFKTGIKYAIFCGLFLSLLLWVSIKIGSNPLSELKHFFFDIIIFFIFIYFAAWEYKRYANDGFLPFWQGMSMAFMVYIPASILFSVSLYLTLYTDVSLIENYRKEAINFLEKKKDTILAALSDEEYENRIKAVEHVTILGLVISSGIKKIVIGFFVAPVVSIILRKRFK